MGECGAITYRLSEADAVSAGRFAAGRQMLLRPISRVLLILIAALYALLLLLDWRMATQPLLVALMAAVGVAVLLAVWVLIPWQMKRHFRQAPGLRDEIELSWDDERLSFETTRGNSRLAWSDYHRWGENERLLLLFQSEILYNIVPKAALNADELAAIREALEQAGVRKI